MTTVERVGVPVPPAPGLATADEAALRARQHELLGDYDLLDVPSDAELDAVVRVAATVAGCTRATVNLLDTERQCQLAAHGFVGADAPREESVCHTTSRLGGVFAAADLSADPRFAGNPFVDGRRDRLRVYASVPLVVEGTPIGTLCVFDVVVRRLTRHQLDRLADLARVVVALLERRRHGRVAAELATGREATLLALAAAHRQLAHARAFDRALLEALPLGVVAVDAEGRLQVFNQVGRSWHSSADPLQLRLADLPGRFALYEPDGTTPLTPDRLPVARAAAEGRTAGVEMVIGHPGGARRTVLCSGVAVRDADGTPLGAVSVMADVTAQRELEQQLRRAALHDPLTGLPNRSLLVDRLEHALAAARRDATPVAVLYCDLDGFKAVNDRFGHAAGDDVLRRAAERMLAAVRPGDTVARIGGDEFVVLCPRVATLATALDIAGRVEAALHEPLTGCDGTAHELGISIGAVVSRTDSTPEAVLGAADVAMYRVKAARRVVAAG